MLLSNVRTFGAVALLCVLPGLALAATPQGEWHGNIQLNPGENATPVTVRFRKDGADVHFKGSRDCHADARFSDEEEGGTLRYVIDWKNGGENFCQRLEDHSLRMTPATDGGLKLDFDTGITRWHGVLYRKAASKR